MIILPGIGVTAPFGTTILGWAAVGEIRRSNGRIHGMWLAVADGLLFPLLLLDGAIAFLCYLATIAAWGSSVGVPDRYIATFYLASLGISLMADGLVIWITVHSVRGAMPPAPTMAARRGVGVLKALAVIGLFGFILLIAAVAIWMAGRPRASAPEASPTNMDVRSGARPVPPAPESPPPASVAIASRSAQPDPREAELNYAKAYLQNIEDQFQAGLAKWADVIDAQEKVDVLQAQMAGDPVQIALARMAAAKERLVNEQLLKNAGLASQTDYDKAMQAFTARLAELADTDKQAALHGALMPSELNPAIGAEIADAELLPTEQDKSDRYQEIAQRPNLDYRAQASLVQAVLKGVAPRVAFRAVSPSAYQAESSMKGPPLTEADKVKILELLIQNPSFGPEANASIKAILDTQDVLEAADKAAIYDLLGKANSAPIAQ
jgi:hypothetical protein